MSWRLKKQLTYLVMFLAVLVLIGFYFYAKSQQPTCFDGKQNQGEEGIDCGGPCAISCEVKELLPIRTETFPVITYPDKSFDLLGVVENPNRGWVLRNALAVFYLYDQFNRLQDKITAGKISILPREVRYVTVLNLNKLDYPVGKVELKIEYDLTQWQKTSLDFLPVSLINQQIKDNTFFAEISNPTGETFRNLELIIRFFDQENNLVGITRSIIQEVKPFETMPISLTLPPADNISDFETSLHLITF